MNVHQYEACVLTWLQMSLSVKLHFSQKKKTTMLEKSQKEVKILKDSSNIWILKHYVS